MSADYAVWACMECGVWSGIGMYGRYYHAGKTGTAHTLHQQRESVDIETSRVVVYYIIVVMYNNTFFHCVTFVPSPQKAWRN